ncbi:MAG: hypothetical protein J7527_01710 [Chitinophagaceae bacterium]|nr:hypothetical protein [Chitinophagaceae bacterium]
MSYQKGIDVSGSILNILALTRDDYKRMLDVYQMTGNVLSMDMSMNAFEKLFNWRESFLASSLPSVSPSGPVNQSEVAALTKSLVELCTQIIQENAVEISKGNTSA